MELKDYTTEELKAELKRRSKIERSLKPGFMSPENHWFLFEGKVTECRKYTITGHKCRVESKVLEKCRYPYINNSREFSLVQSMFSNKDKPQVGDIVEMRARKYANGNIGFLDAKITKIIKRHET